MLRLERDATLPVDSGLEMDFHGCRRGYRKLPVGSYELYKSRDGCIFTTLRHNPSSGIIAVCFLQI